MNNYSRLKEIIASDQHSVGRFFSAFVRRGKGMPHNFAWARSMRPNKPSYKKIRQWQNRYSGQRCFIVGNGPSLKSMDLSPLRNEYTFGLNRIYLMFDQIGFATTFHVVMNELVMEQCATEIAQSSSEKFLGWNCRRLFPVRDDITYVHQTYHPTFTRDIANPIWGGATVTYATMQIAHYLGFHVVVLIGVDHSFSAKGTPHKVIVSMGDDTDHFDPRYFGKGFRWQLPDLMTSEVAYTMAKVAYEEDGRSIVDATINGRLQVFPKVDYHSLF